MMGPTEREKKLPVWAQERLAALRGEVKSSRDRQARMEAAHAVLTGREWFTLRGPHEGFDVDPIRLFTLSRDGAHCVCSLGVMDLLLVGRGGLSAPLSEPDEDSVQGGGIRRGLEGDRRQ